MVLIICTKCGNEIPWYKAICPHCDGTGKIKRIYPPMNSIYWDKKGGHETKVKSY